MSYSQEILLLPSPVQLLFIGNKNSSENYLGTEYVSKIENNLENIQLILNERLKQYTQAYYALLPILYIVYQSFWQKENLIVCKNNRNSIPIIDKFPSDFDQKKVTAFKRVI